MGYFKNKDIEFQGQAEILDQPLYDIRKCDRYTVDFFTLCMGEQSKTFADTNMVTSGFLPRPCAFVLKQIELFVYQGELSSRARRSGYMQFIIGNKEYYKVPLHYAIEVGVWLHHEIVILPAQNFCGSVSANFLESDKNTEIMYILRGEYVRPLQ